MKNKLFPVYSALFTLLVSINAFAENDESQKGENSELLKKVLLASAQGNCPADIMSPLLQSACEKQMPAMAQALSQHGAITKTEFLGIQQTQMGASEAYRVLFENGSMTWLISTQQDGKILVLWSPG